jgi:hypothetical protein
MSTGDETNVTSGPWPQQPAASGPVETGGGGPHSPDMVDIRERLVRVEEAVRGLRHSQGLLMGAISIGFGLVIALMLAFGVYALGRVDASDSKLAALPGQINQSLMDLTGTIAESITAAKQQAPQVILVPAPPQAPPQPRQSPAPEPPKKQ